MTAQIHQDSLNLAKMNAEAQSIAQGQLSKPILKRGDKGTAVKELQNLLGYWDIYSGEIDGNFSSEVEVAVKSYQRRVFLKEDGIVGQLTWQALYSGAPVNMPVLRRGDRGQAVTTLQSVLKASGEFKQEPTGSFGTITDTAVRAFQKRKALLVDGIVGAKTWHALSKVPH